MQGCWNRGKECRQIRVPGGLGEGEGEGDGEGEGEDEEEDVLMSISTVSTTGKLSCLSVFANAWSSRVMYVTVRIV